GFDASALRSDSRTNSRYATSVTATAAITRLMIRRACALDSPIFRPSLNVVRRCIRLPRPTAQQTLGTGARAVNACMPAPTFVQFAWRSAPALLRSSHRRQAVVLHDLNRESRGGASPRKTHTGRPARNGGAVSGPRRERRGGRPLSDYQHAADQAERAGQAPWGHPPAGGAPGPPAHYLIPSPRQTKPSVRRKPGGAPGPRGAAGPAGGATELAQH